MLTEYAPHSLRHVLERLDQGKPLELQHTKIPRKLRGQTTYILRDLVLSVLMDNYDPEHLEEDTKDGEMPPAMKEAWDQYWNGLCQQFGKIDLAQTFQGLPPGHTMHLQQHLAKASTQDFIDTIDYTFQFVMKFAAGHNGPDGGPVHIRNYWSGAERLNVFFLLSNVGYQLLPYGSKKFSWQKHSSFRALWIRKIDSKYAAKPLLRRWVSKAKHHEFEYAEYVEQHRAELDERLDSLRKNATARAKKAEADDLPEPTEADDLPEPTEADDQTEPTEADDLPEPAEADDQTEPTEADDQPAEADPPEKTTA